MVDTEFIDNMRNLAIENTGIPKHLLEIDCDISKPMLQHLKIQDDMIRRMRDNALQSINKLIQERRKQDG